MRAVDIIVKKRDRQELSYDEIEFFVLGFATGEIPDYQASAWAMAVLLNGMTPRETTDLTLAMTASGDTLNLDEVAPVVVDKHSTGGVGDKTSLVVGPTVAACGLAVGKMSGRGLGFSGGTLDKMDSIPGFRSDLSTMEFVDQLNEVGIVMTGQTADLAPADGKLYALRDVTGTVQSIPLIASSVMSKKIAAGADAIVLDVKVGCGAFMKTFEDANALATLMVSIASLAGRRAVAILSDMNQPLGFAVGNAIEVKEAIQTMNGEGPLDFYEHCLVIAAQMLVIGGVAASETKGKEIAQSVIQKGQALERFKALVAAQGGDVSYIMNPGRLPTAEVIRTIPSPQTGYLKEINARIVGETAVFLGAGRAKKDDEIDLAVGVEVKNKVGDLVNAGEPLFVIHTNHENRLGEAVDQMMHAYRWSDTPVEPLPLFYGVVKE
ncbi:MAG: thymidine phosphorylase [Anaerolineales bacterium]|nr:thymidine phosphorylase [Anaerolineales bacterium]